MGSSSAAAAAAADASHSADQGAKISLFVSRTHVILSTERLLLQRIER